jgi:isocitrate/isopropylmalate dehydrogenase
LSVLNLAIFDGDGIGPEIIAATTEVLVPTLDALGVPHQLTSSSIGLRALADHGTTLPETALTSAHDADGIILGPVSHMDYPPMEQGGVNPSGQLRRELDLYANIRPARTFTGVPTIAPADFDLVFVRENTEGFYADRTMVMGTGEVMPTENLALSFRKVTRHASERIARTAFELARERRRRVTAVHKANVLRTTDGLFLESVRTVAAEYADVEYSEELVDAMAALLIRDAARFDVIVTTNMFGDILSDEATELSGSIGLAASLNAGEHLAMAQAQHGSAPGLAGTDVANPASLIGSTSMLLTWLAERNGDDRLARAGGAIEAALSEAVSTERTRTKDLGGSMGTRDFARLIAELTRRHLDTSC